SLRLQTILDSCNVLIQAWRDDGSSSMPSGQKAYASDRRFEAQLVVQHILQELALGKPADAISIYLEEAAATELRAQGAAYKSAAITQSKGKALSAGQVKPLAGELRSALKRVRRTLLSAGLNDGIAEDVDKR